MNAGDHAGAASAAEAPGAAGAQAPEAARAALAELLTDSGRAVSPAVRRAFRIVARHLFLPGIPSASAYADQAFVIKYGEDGLPVSSSSQPAMMAIMLEQLGLQPGQRVLEIGTGTGYNAALMAQIVGSQQSVVTIDIDAELIARARANLTAAGAGQVRVRCGDGGFGVPEHAPYDRIIVTAGAWSLAPQWLAQLAPGGRIVLPLSVRGIQLSAAFEARGGCWSSISAFRCGFIKMSGALAGPEIFVPLGPQPGWHVQADDGRAVDCDGLYQALTGPAADVPAGLGVPGGEQLSDLDLWLTVTEPRLTRLTVLGTRRPFHWPPPIPLGSLADAPPGGPPGGLAVAALVAAPRRPRADVMAPPAGVPVVLRGYGPAGLRLAEQLAGRVQAWHELGRPGIGQLCLRACPRGREPPARPGWNGPIVLDRGDLRLTVSWPPHPG